MDDLISRQDAINVVDAVWSVTGDKNVAKVWDQIKDLPYAQPEQIARDIATIIENEKDMRVILKNAQPEPAIPLSWIENRIAWLKSLDNPFSTLTAMQISTMVKKWKEEQDASN